MELDADSQRSARLARLEESLIESAQEFESLYRLLPGEQRVQLNKDARELEKRMRLLAQSTGYYEGDKQAQKKLDRQGNWIAVGLLLAWITYGGAQLVGIQHFEEKMPIWAMLATSGALMLLQWFERLLSRQALVRSARQLARDEEAIQAFGAGTRNRCEKRAALRYLNEFLDASDAELTADELRMHYLNFTLTWKVSDVEDRLTASGIEW